MAPEERREIQALVLDIVTLVLQVHRAPLDLPDPLFPFKEGEDMTITPGITQLLKEKKVIVDYQAYLKFQVTGQTLTFTL